MGIDVALSTVCLPNDLGWEGCLGEAAKLGYARVELLMIPGFHGPGPDELSAEALTARAAEHGVSIVAIHAGEIDGLTDASAEATCSHVESVIAFAHSAGVPLVNINGGYTPDDFDPAERPAVLDRIGRVLAKLEPKLQQLGVRITLENHFHYQFQQPSDFERLFSILGGSPCFGATIDTGHYVPAGVDVEAFTRALGPRLAHVHLKDQVGEHSVPYGEGVVDIAAVLALLREVGYAGCCTVEVEFLELESAVDYREVLREARRYLTGIDGQPVR